MTSSAKLSTPPPPGAAPAATDAAALRPALSVIVPLFNEQDSVRPLHAALVQALAALGREYEMVFVDDGSSEGTVSAARQIARGDPRLRIVKFRRNYGQTAAMAAGIEYARGEILVTMDGDLQNDPADIALLLEQIEAGFDVKGLKTAVETHAAGGKLLVLFNFPNNPTGYSVTAAEADAIRDVLVEAAEAGCDVVAVCDDAYFGLFYDDHVLKESLFTRLAAAHPRLLAFKLDGASKEDYAWGLRVGFITYGIAGGSGSWPRGSGNVFHPRCCRC